MSSSEISTTPKNITSEETPLDVPTETFQIGGRDFDFYIFKPGIMHGEDKYKQKKARFMHGDLRRTNEVDTNNIFDQQILPAAIIAEFDSLTEYRHIRHGRMKAYRRNHMLSICATQYNRDIRIVHPIMEKEDCEKLSKDISLLFAVLQGQRMKYANSSTRVYYKLNMKLFNSLLTRLEEIGERMKQVSEFEDYELLIPEFGHGSEQFNYRGIYNKQDWELIANAFKCEVETYLKIMLTLGYDNQPVVAAEPVTGDENDFEDDEDEDALGYTPRRIRSDVLDLTSGRRTVRDLYSNRTFEQMSEEENRTILAELEKQRARPSSHNVEPEEEEGENQTIELPSERHVIPDSQPQESSQDGDRASHSQPVMTVPSAEINRATSRVTIREPPYDTQSPTPYRTPNTSLRSIFRTNPSTNLERLIPTSFEAQQVEQSYGLSINPTISRGPDYTSDRYNELFGTSQQQNQQELSQYFNGFGPTPNSQSHQGIASAPGDPDPGGDNDDDGGDDNDRNNRLPNFPPNLPNPGSHRGNPPNNNNNSSGGGNLPNGDPYGNTPNNNFSNYLGGGLGIPGSRPNNPIKSAQGKWINPLEVHFDTKLKPDIIPIWDGDDMKLGKWIMQINEIATRSDSVFRGLGDIIPSRLTGKASEWWYSLTKDDRRDSSINWDTMKNRIRTYWMNQAWINKMQYKALRARFREIGYGNESPTEYFIRKSELLTLVYQFPEKQVVHEILKTAPATWHGVLQPATIQTLTQLHNLLKFNEENLERLVEQFEPKFKRRNENQNSRTKSEVNKVETNQRRNTYSNNKFRKGSFKGKPPRSYATGWTGKKPEFPRDDLNVSKGRTPEQVGARPCQYCGSPKHWDKECKHAKKAFKAQVNFTEISVDVLRAEADYREAYLASQEDSTPDQYGDDESYDEMDEEISDDDYIESSPMDEDDSDF